MKAMKTFAAIVLFAAMSTTVVNAQTKEKMKEHKCTSACTKDKHVYAHGEKGHKCTDACKKMDKKKA
jgi:hypothetical protein